MLVRSCLCGGGHRPEGLENHFGSSGTSYAQRLSVQMPILPKKAGKNVKLRPLCVKSFHAHSSLLVQAQPGRFEKLPQKFWNLTCPKVECTDAYGTQRTRQKCEITSIVRKIFARLLVRRRAQAGRFGKPPRKLHSSSCLHENAEDMDAMGTHITD